MALDTDKILADVMAPEVFGESVNYRPVSGAAFDLVDAVFTAGYLGQIVVDGDVATTTNVPTLGVRIGAFPAGVVPAQDDQVYVPKVGATYVVREARPDGQGHALLLLNKVS